MLMRKVRAAREAERALMAYVVENIVEHSTARPGDLFQQLAHPLGQPLASHWQLAYPDRQSY